MDNQEAGDEAKTSIDYRLEPRKRDPTVSSHLDDHFRSQGNLETRKLSANSIIRFLKTELAPTGLPLYGIVMIKGAFATSSHIKQNLEDEWGMLDECPLDTYDLEDEYVLAERNTVPKPGAPTLNSLIQPLVLLLTGYDSVPEDPNTKDVDLNSSLFDSVRESKKEYWRGKPYPEILAITMESYLRRREGRGTGESIRRGWYPYPDYSHVDNW
ncbi:hypothetical protein TWF506_001838 [Arthrobotrys conoides]|uniref:Uncharacterized protein n=1 Tax=Arthrobotrys conoides TaxID=74498 RepID=A0AAN8S5T3_9PEZI